MTPGGLQIAKYTRLHQVGDPGRVVHGQLRHRVIGETLVAHDADELVPVGDERRAPLPSRHLDLGARPGA